MNVNLPKNLSLAFSEKDGAKKVPSGNQGGFWSPAAALGDVLLDRLIQVGIEYQYRTVAKKEEKGAKADKEATDEPKQKDKDA